MNWPEFVNTRSSPKYFRSMDPDFVQQSIVTMSWAAACLGIRVCPNRSQIKICSCLSVMLRVHVLCLRAWATGAVSFTFQQCQCEWSSETSYLQCQRTPNIEMVLNFTEPTLIIGMKLGMSLRMNFLVEQRVRSLLHFTSHNTPIQVWPILHKVYSDQAVSKLQVQCLIQRARERDTSLVKDKTRTARTQLQHGHHTTIRPMTDHAPGDIHPQASLPLNDWKTTLLFTLQVLIQEHTESESAIQCPCRSSRMMDTCSAQSSVHGDEKRTERRFMWLVAWRVMSQTDLVPENSFRSLCCRNDGLWSLSETPESSSWKRPLNKNSLVLSLSHCMPGKWLKFRVCQRQIASFHINRTESINNGQRDQYPVPHHNNNLCS